MINFLTPRKSTPTTSARTFLTRLAGVVAERRVPSVVEQTTQPAETPAVAVSAPVDLPELADIEAAASAYAKAAEQAREADRAKRKARKTLDGLDAGVYGAWRIFRKPSARVTPDMEKIAAIFKAHGLGEVPTRPVADSLVVERAVDTTPNPEQADAELLALAGAR